MGGERIIIMQYAVKRFAESKEKGLCLIDMPTGTGKTYLTSELIARFIKGETISDVESIIYVTPLKKNTSDVHKEIRKHFLDSEKDLFENSVLILLPNYEKVVENLSNPEFVDSIPDFYRRKDSFKDLKIKVDDYNRLLEIGNYAKDMANQALKDIRTKYEVQFRRDVEYEISKLAKTKQAKKTLVFGDDYLWLRQLYPSCYSNYRKVLIMTMDKFLSTNDPIIDKPYTFLSHLSNKKTMVFIDEFDATKDVILNREIERCVDYKIDLIKMFSSITSALKGREFPKQLFAESEKSEQGFLTMKKRLLEIEAKHYLNYLPKLEESEDTDRHFLFDDFNIHTISASDNNKKIVIENDKELNQNIIKFHDKNDSDESFYSAVYAIKTALNTFIKCCARMAREYKNKQNERVKGTTKEYMEIEQAVSSIVDFYNLDESLKEVLSELISNDIALPKKDRGSNPFDTDFYMNGFRYYDFSDDLNHDASTVILMCFLKNTPERFILSLSDKARVVGLSATASIETVTGNYNLEYIRRKLTEDYYELPLEDKVNIEKYVKNALSSDYPILIHPISINSGEPENLAKMIFHKEANIELFTGIFEKHLIAGKKDANYENTRTARILIAIREFLENKKSRVLLSLTNKNVRTSDKNDPFNQGLLEDAIKMLADEIGCDEPHHHYLFGNDFESEKKKYLKEVKNKEKVILFSSYPAVGTGQNLQYEENSGDNDEAVKKDIDSLYVELPTNIIVQNKSLGDEQNLIKYIYQMESLRRSGDISKSVAQKNITKAFKQFMNPEKNEIPDNTPYKTVSANNHMVKILVQAIGRICRTKKDNYKNEVNIYIDNSIYNRVRFKFMEGRLMNREFEEVIKRSNVEEPFNVETIRALNKADELNDRVQKRLSRVLGENRAAWSEASMLRWKLIRQAILKHPTISKEELDELSKEPGLEVLSDFYIFNTEGKKICYYSYGPTLEDRQFLFGRTEKQDYVHIDEAGCRLNLIRLFDVLRDGFEKKGYATSFEPNDGMLLPVVYQNIYKGALGEEAGRIILESWGFELDEIEDPDKFEKFDFCFKRNHNVYIDFKNWTTDEDEQKNLKLLNAPKKLELVGGTKLFIINIFGETDEMIKESEKIVKIPTLFKYKNGKYYPLAYDVKKIRECIERAIRHGNY